MFCCYYSKFPCSVAVVFSVIVIIAVLFVCHSMVCFFPFVAHFATTEQCFCQLAIFSEIAVLVVKPRPHRQSNRLIVHIFTCCYLFIVI